MPTSPETSGGAPTKVTRNSEERVKIVDKPASLPVESHEAIGVLRYHERILPSVAFSEVAYPSR